MPIKIDHQTLVAELQKELLKAQEEKHKVEENLKNRVALLEYENEELERNQQVTIQRALNESKKKLKMKDEEIKRSVEESL